MDNLKCRCVELARDISNKRIVSDVIGDAKLIYDWVKDCPVNEQSLPASKRGGEATILSRDLKSDLA